MPTDDLADAMRYRWLKAQKGLELKSCGTRWMREDGSTFLSSHRLAAGSTQFAPAESLDLMIDAAIKVQREQKEQKEQGKQS